MLLGKCIRLAVAPLAATSFSMFANCNADITQQPSFLGTTNLRKTIPKPANRLAIRSLKDMALITGSAHKELAQEISAITGVPLTPCKVGRFSDGEVNIEIQGSLHGKTVFIVQPCASPVNDSIMELLLAVSCANRAAATRVIAVIPYFGYKHHRRGAPVSSTSHSRFLSSSAMDFARMLQEMGVDHVITVDLQVCTLA